ATAADLAGNVVTKEIDLNEGQNKPEVARADDNKPFANPALPAADSKTMSPPLPTNSPVASTPSGPAGGALVSTEPRTTAPPAPPAPPAATETRIESRSEKVSAPAVPGPPPSNCQYLAGTHVSIKFELDKSASQAIEVWLTSDEGQSWQKLPAATQKGNAI